MSDTYRGFPIPEIVEVDGWYWILDPKFGDHWAYKQALVVHFWKNKVDSVIIEDALEMGLVERVGASDQLACEECGLLIHDVFKHLAWHRTH